MGYLAFLAVLSGVSGFPVEFRMQCMHVGDLYWVNPTTDERIGVAEMQPFARAAQLTDHGHRFELRVAGFASETVTIDAEGFVNFDVKGGKIKATGSSLGYYKGERWDEIVTPYHSSCEELWTNPDERGHFCNGRFDRRMLNTAKFDYDNESWLTQMEGKWAKETRLTNRQPAGLHNFTEVGFKDTDIPADLLRDLQAFHRSTRTNVSKPEEFPYDDPATPGRVTDSWHNPLPEDLQERLFAHVKSEASKWTGVPESDLEKVACYGIRMYHHSATLRKHVDRRETHVLSAILQIDRPDDDTAPWPLQILDHAGVEHAVPARVGQLVLYESATCAHGRPTPFPGREMANAFVHFKPAGWPVKYDRMDL